ncbi:MAG: hypothetical protein HC888_06700 [Candidatus Competibacteraceae bacterium]|nr:hypothetical protein [Candidatus Competibacteraceae bacterium]
MSLERPRAVGNVVGSLKRFEDGTATLELQNGEKYRCKLGGWKAKRYCTSEEIQMYSVYPKRRNSEILFKVVSSIKNTEGREDGRFFINGKVEKIKESRVVLSVWSTKHQKNYWIDVQGKLDCKAGEYWKIEAKLSGQELKIEQAERLSEVFNLEEVMEGGGEPAITVVEEVVQGAGSERAGAI